MLGTSEPFSFEDLRGLIQEARRQGFYIGPDQVIAISQVMLQLTRDPERAATPDHLKTALGAIICKTPNEQTAFYQVFERWHRLHMAESLRVAGQHRAARALTETDLPVSRPLPYIAFAAVLIAAVFFGSVYYYLRDPVIDDGSTQIVDGGGQLGGGDQTQGAADEQPSALGKAGQPDQRFFRRSFGALDGEPD